MPMARKFSYLLSFFIAFAGVSALAEQDRANESSETGAPQTTSIMVRDGKVLIKGLNIRVSSEGRPIFDFDTEAEYELKIESPSEAMIKCF